MYFVYGIYCLGLLFFIFPKHLGVLVVLCWDLDNLDELNLYNWNEAVHEWVVRSLQRTYEIFNLQKNSVELHLVGCVTVLQISLSTFWIFQFGQVLYFLNWRSNW